MRTLGRLVGIWRAAPILAAAVLAAGWSPGSATAAPPRQAPPQGPPTFESNEFCLACHETPGRLRRLPSGEWLGLTVDRQGLAGSAHADTACAACHTRQASLPHEAAPQSRRSLMLTVGDSCALCHREQRDVYEEGIHGVSQDLGVSRAASCVDCHSGHAVRPVDQWKESEKAERCGACHRGADPAFALAGAGHQEGGAAYFVERFLVILTAIVLGFGFLHVELDVLRWAAERWRGRHGRRIHRP